MAKLWSDFTWPERLRLPSLKRRDVLEVLGTLGGFAAIYYYCDPQNSFPKDTPFTGFLKEEEDRIPELNPRLGNATNVLLVGHIDSADRAQALSSLKPQLAALKARGFTDLVIEIPLGHRVCDEIMTFVETEQRQGVDPWLLKNLYPNEYFDLLLEAKRQGLRVSCGDRPLSDGKDGPQIWHLRNQFMADNLEKLVREGRKPILLTGAFHVNPVEALVAERKGVSVASYTSGFAGGVYEASRGLKYPHLDDILYERSQVRSDNWCMRKRQYSGAPPSY